jgi:HEAT repeat protein
LHDFTCAHLVNKLSSKNDEYLGVFATVVAIGERSWEESLKAYMLSPTPAVRRKGAVAATYFPPSIKLQPTLRALLDDPKEVIREEAAFALSRYQSKSITGLHAAPPPPVHQVLQNAFMPEAANALG